MPAGRAAGGESVLWFQLIKFPEIFFVVRFFFRVFLSCSLFVMQEKCARTFISSTAELDKEFEHG
jgi:hypothetical protein